VPHPVDGAVIAYANMQVFSPLQIFRRATGGRRRQSIAFQCDEHSDPSESGADAFKDLARRERREIYTS
jgi:hypothetical protein